MSVWFVIPSKRQGAELYTCLEAWHEQGYRIAIAREMTDPIDSCAQFVDSYTAVHSYQGWARSTNLVIANVMAEYADAEWFVGGGDDYFPDPRKTADEIAAECNEAFLNLHIVNKFPWMADSDPRPISKPAVSHTFGVMQPTGDRWGEKNGEATIDRIAGSPWMGREFCRRMYRGGGPLYNGYFHNFADEELQCVAQKMEVFWQRRDLMQEHRHWARPRGDWRDAPAWAHAINNPAQSDWNKSKALFAARKAAGFPGSEPLEL